jgi:predicted DNA-binding transcriptional regulator YafY
MIEQQKILRILQIIAKLRQSTGYTKTELAKEFNVSIRTIERYFIL